MADKRTLETQVAGLAALKDRLSHSSFARTHVTKLHSAAEALSTLAEANDGTGQRAHRLADGSKRYLDAIQRSRLELQMSELGGTRSLDQEFAERCKLQPDRYANEIVQAFGRADPEARIAWLKAIVENCDGRSFAAVQGAPDFVTGIDREMLGKFREVMEERHAPDLAARRQTFISDIEAAKAAIDQASRIAETALSIDDVDSAVAARERVMDAQEQLRAATE